MNGYHGIEHCELGLIIKKPVVVHSRSRVKLRNEAKRKGRHTGKLA